MLTLVSEALRCWILSALVVRCAVAGNPDAKRLYDDLLSNYNKLVRPVVNTSDVLRVCIKLKLSQLIDVNLKNQIMTTNLWVEQSWYDYKLRWEPKEYGGVHMLHVPSDHIWRPDIVLYNKMNYVEDVAGNYIMEFKSESAEVVNRIKRTRDIVNNLKARLNYERELLAEERKWSSLLSTPEIGKSTFMNMERFGGPCEPIHDVRFSSRMTSATQTACKTCSYPVHLKPIERTCRKICNRRFQHLPHPQALQQIEDDEILDEENERVFDPIINYQEYLDDIDNMCQKEMKNVKKNIKYLCKIQRNFKKLRRRKENLLKEHQFDEDDESSCHDKYRYRRRPDDTDSVSSRQRSYRRSTYLPKRKHSSQKTSSQDVTTIPLKGAYLVVSKNHLPTTSKDTIERRHRKKCPEKRSRRNDLVKNIIDSNYNLSEMVENLKLGVSSSHEDSF